MPKAGPIIDGTAPAVVVYRSSLLPHSETFIKEQVLAYRRWRAILTGRRCVDQLVLDGLPIRLIGTQSANIFRRAHAKLHSLLHHPLGTETLRRENVRLVHAHFGLDSLEAAPLARALRRPLVVTLHGYDINIHREWWEAGHAGPGGRHYPRRLLALARERSVQFIAVSDAIKHDAIRFGIPAEKLTTHYIGIDTARFRPGPVPIADRGPHVLFVGRLVEKKGCEYLLRAMRLVQNQIPEATLSIVGTGPLREALQSLSQSLGLKATFRGALPTAEVKGEFDKARAFCLPSIRAENGDAESFGMVILEAQACGVPVITSARGGAQEGILNGETGYEVAEKDVPVMAQRLIELLTDDAQAARMSALARRFVAERFDISKTTPSLEAFYDDIAGVLSP